MIKFRAWIKDVDGDEEFDYVPPMTIQEMIHSKKSTFSLKQLNDLVEFEQFTGLKDVNGKEIYEGDIVQPIMLYTDRNIGEPFEVKKGNYVYGKWIAKSVSSKGFGVNGYYFSNEIKVSGNAHTNPKPLKGENN